MTFADDMASDLGNVFFGSNGEFETEAVYSGSGETINVIFDQGTEAALDPIDGVQVDSMPIQYKALVKASDVDANPIGETLTISGTVYEIVAPSSVSEDGLTFDLYLDKQ